MALAALGVFMVPSTRCPVSPAETAMRTVSTSRSSPTTMTSGSSRSEPLSAVRNDLVVTPTSRWLIMAFLRGCTCSTGSSTVMMWCERSLFSRSTIAASVVVFPWPVGPVTTMSPWWWCVACATPSGRPSAARVGTSRGITRRAILKPVRWLATLTRKRAPSGPSSAKSAEPSVSRVPRSRAGTMEIIIFSTRTSGSGSPRGASSNATRKSGGRPATRWRSEALLSTAARRSASSSGGRGMPDMLVSVASPGTAA
jgi:hypothetical protein